jgi:hopanoid biosynthesis associated RND transporter like protein HpnN
MNALGALVERITAFCVPRAALVVAVVLAATLLAAWFVAGHFRMTTETEALLSPKLEFRQHELKFDAAFPTAETPIVVVIDGKTPEATTLASRRLVADLQARSDLFTRVRDPRDETFFRQNGLLFLDLDKVKDDTAQMIKAQPFLAPIARDPSLRGVLDGLSIALDGVASGQTSLSDIVKPINGLRAALEDVGREGGGRFSWREIISGEPAKSADLRRLVLIDPKLDFSSLQPAENAVGVIRDTAKAAGLDSAHGVTVRLTGPAVLADEEFSTLAEHMGIIAGLMLAAIVVMLWLAVQSVRTILCILLSTFVGLIFAAALGLAMFGAFNVISVAFIPLFVGLGIDFGIQYSVRFRAEQRADGGPSQALLRASRAIGGSLALAAAAISAGFLTFLPTRYVGVSQLGAIAGLGLLLALVLSVSFLPALLQIVKPRGSLPESGFGGLNKTDSFVLSHRRYVLAMGGGLALVCLALLPFLRFDFNPLHLRSEKTESVATLLDLYDDEGEEQSVNVVNVLAPSLEAAQPIAAKLEALPEVYSVVTLADFIPQEQDRKLAMIQDASFLLDTTLNPLRTRPAPTDAETRAALSAAAAKLHNAARGDLAAAGSQAEQLSVMLDRLAKGSPVDRARAADAVLPGLLAQLDDMRMALTAQPVTRANLPLALVHDWIAPDGRARIVASPRGNSNDNKMLQHFARAVLNVAPDATGAPISIQKSARAIQNAFIIAGVLSFVAITLILFVALRRTTDVLITLAPIVLTALLTLGCAVVFDIPLNFANVIALPLLFGIGVAFHIYFVMAWRHGEGHLLSSSLARGVFFSALTTATGFGALWLSSHPGTASMGKLLMISLVWTLVSALLFQPALMGPAPVEKQARA